MKILDEASENFVLCFLSVTGGDLWPSSGPSSPQNRLDPRYTVTLPKFTHNKIDECLCTFSSLHILTDDVHC